MSEIFRNLINQGVLAAKSGNRELAEGYFKQAIQENPRDARGWYYYALAVTDPAESRRALETVLQLDPYHEQARARLEQTRVMPPPPMPSPAPWNNQGPVPLPQMYTVPREAFPPRTSRNFILLGFILVLVVGVIFALWAYQQFSSKSVDPDLEAVINANIRALRDEDLNAYMGTLHPDSPAYEQTEQITVQLLTQYDLEYEIEKMELVSQSGNKAKVRVVQVTRKLSGPAFQDNRITAIHELRRYQGEWRLYNTFIENVEYLN